MTISYTDFEQNYLIQDGDTLTKANLNAAPAQIKKELSKIDGAVSVLSNEPLNTWFPTNIYAKGEWVSYLGKDYYSDSENNYGIIPGTSGNWIESPLRSSALMGSLEDLTVSGNTLVEAINNVSATANQAFSNIGYLSMMPTVEKSNVAGALTEMFNMIGRPSGVAQLDTNGQVPAHQLPSYVDDVVEFTNFASLPVVGELSKIYVTLNDSIAFRWSGTVYVAISSGSVDWQYVFNRPTTGSGYGITDLAPINNPVFTTGISTPLIDMTYAKIDDLTVELSTVSQTPLILGAISSVRSAELLLQVERGTDFHVTKLNIIHNGTTAWVSEYGTVFSNGSLASFSADVSGTDLRLLISGTSSTLTNYKMLVSYIKV